MTLPKALRTSDDSTLLAVAIFVAALAVRLPFIIRGETLLHSDEAIVGCMAQDIAAFRNFPIYFYGQAYMGALEAYLIAGFSWFISDPIFALRLGPAFFFALLAAAQFLLLKELFSKRMALLAILLWLAASPALTQWSVAPRGAYIEALLWATWIWLCYFRFAGNVQSARFQLLFGLLLGSGLWINPMVLILCLPLLFHYCLQFPWRKKFPTGFRLLDRLSCGLPLQLPLLALAAFFLLTCLWTVQVSPGGVKYQALFGLCPGKVFYPIIAVLILGILITRRLLGLEPILKALRQGRLLIIGLLLGFSPDIVYTVKRTLAALPSEGTLPLGPRPLWELGETFNYFWQALAVLFGPDPRPYLTLAQMGRPIIAQQLSPAAGLFLSFANAVSLTSTLILLLWLIYANFTEIKAVLALKTNRLSPAALMLFGAVIYCCFYLLSGTAFNFTSNRYLVPLWFFLPALLVIAATPSNYLPQALLSLIIVLNLCGQYLFWQSLGAQHSLRPLTGRLLSLNPGLFSANTFDTHLLRYLSAQKLDVQEWNPFWPRFEHARPAKNFPAAPVQYLVQSTAPDLTAPWKAAGFPGPAPVETVNQLPATINREVAAGRNQVLAKIPLGVADYELWTLAQPLPEPNRQRLVNHNSAN